MIGGPKLSYNEYFLYIIKLKEIQKYQKGPHNLPPEYYHTIVGIILVLLKVTNGGRRTTI